MHWCETLAEGGTLLPVRDVGEHDGRMYYTMEWVDGPDLATVLRETGLADAANGFVDINTFGTPRQILVALDQLHGVIYCASQEDPGRFTKESLDLLTALAFQLGIALQGLLAASWGQVDPLALSSRDGATGRNDQLFRDLLDGGRAGEEILAALRQSGLCSLMVPAEFGGAASQPDPLAICVVREVLARGAGTAPGSIGTTTFRPPYSPVEFGAIAGLKQKPLASRCLPQVGLEQAHFPRGHQRWELRDLFDHTVHVLLAGVGLWLAVRQFAPDGMTNPLEVVAWWIKKSAGLQAYRMAGIKDPIKELDFVELHDAYTSSEIQTYEDMGLCRYGEGGKFIDEGHPELTGKIPVNPSGGLLACGHPVGATGLMQAVTMFWQLQRTIPKHFANDRLQVKNARRGLIHSHAGTGTYVSVSVLEREV